ncbi:MAG: hypothetical protein IKF19_00450 [Bacilli bacterium]|nr:hypothetical protein [Bacilli bacterium]
MPNNKDFIKKTQYYNHTLKLLKDIIINIEAHPEIDKMNNLYNLENYNEELAEKNKQKANKLIRESNLNKIKTLLSEIEDLSIKHNNKIKNNDIIKKIRYLNDYNLEQTYQKEKEIITQKIINKTKQLQNELNKLNKEIPLYIEITNTKNGYSITETINNELTIGDIFKIIPIKELTKDLKIEEYEENLYADLEKNSIKSNYNLYSNNIENISQLRKKFYPELKIIKKLKKNSNNLSFLLKEGNLIADLLIMEKQLEDLLSNLSTENYKKTSEYLNRKINILTHIINAKQKNFFQEIKKELPKLNFSKNEYSTLELEILNVSLENSEQEFKEKFNYKNNNIIYQEVLKEDLENYQKKIIKEEFNLELSPKKIKKLIK